MMTWCLPFYQNAACHSKVPPTDSAWYKSMAFAIELSTEHSVIQMLRTGFGDHPVSAGLGWAEIIYAKKKGGNQRDVKVYPYHIGAIVYWDSWSK